MSDLNDYTTWKRVTRNQIFAAAVAQLSIEYVREGRGGVTPEAMKAIAEEAAAISELWEESCPE